MNKKVTTYLLSLIRKNEKVCIYEKDTKYWVTDGCILFRFNKEEFELNPQLFIKHEGFKEVIESINLQEYQDAEIYCYKHMHGITSNRLFAEIIRKDKVKSCVKVEYLNYFKNCKFKVKGKTDMVLCTNERNEIVGGILPLRMGD